MNIHDERLFIGWVLSVLTGGGVAAGDSQKPAAVPTGAAYAVVYSIAGGVTDGPIDAPLDDATPNFQVTSSSLDPAQCRWLAMKVRTLLAEAVPATIGARKTTYIDFPMASMTVLRDNDVSPPRFFCPDRFEVGTVPA